MNGEGFRYDLIQPVVQIAIMDHTLFPEHRRFLTKYQLRDDEGFVYSDKLEFIVMDLTAMDEANQNEEDQGLLEWAEASNANDWNTVDRINNDGVQEAVKTMSMIMSTPSERQKIWDRRMAIWDYNTSIAGAKAEGYNAGHEEGYNEGESRLSDLISRLSAQKRFDDIIRCTSDPEYRKQLYQEFNL